MALTMFACKIEEKNNEYKPREAEYQSDAQLWKDYIYFG